jgi:hypothetical protein
MRRGHHHGHGPHGSHEGHGAGGSQESQVPQDTVDLPGAVRGWFTGRLPQDWFVGDGDQSAVDVQVDREEITVVGTIAAPQVADGASEAERSAAADGRARQFRESTREQRIAIAREAEHHFGRKVAWGVEVEGSRMLFTHLAVPVMTRLRQPERQVLDTLVGAGVARSRSEALAWSVRLVGQHADEWLRELRSAMEEVERVRAKGPDTAGGGSGETPAAPE